MGSMPIITVIPEAVDTTLFKPNFLRNSNTLINDILDVEDNANYIAIDNSIDRDASLSSSSSSIRSIQVDQIGLSSYIHTDLGNNSDVHTNDDNDDVEVNKYLKEAIKKSITKGCVIVYNNNDSNISSIDDNKNNSSDDSNNNNIYDGRIQCKEDSKFEFLSIFKWEYRKGWDLLLNAYWTAFKPSDNVVLRLRTYVPSFEG